MRIKPTAIIDLDNCISDEKWRQHLCQLDLFKPNDRYWAYHEACPRDTRQNAHVVEELARNYTLVVFTARPECVRRKTERWLKKWNVPYDLLCMRPNDNHEPSVPLKRQMLLTLPAEYDVQYAIDDRMDVLDMYADEGVRVCRRVSVNPMEIEHP